MTKRNRSTLFRQNIQSLLRILEIVLVVVFVIFLKEKVYGHLQKVKETKFMYNRKKKRRKLSILESRSENPSRHKPILIPLFFSEKSLVVHPFKTILKVNLKISLRMLLLKRFLSVFRKTIFYQTFQF